MYMVEEGCNTIAKNFPANIQNCLEKRLVATKVKRECIFGNGKVIVSEA